MKKTKIKRKGAGDGPFFTKLQLSRSGIDFEYFNRSRQSRQVGLYWLLLIKYTKSNPNVKIVVSQKCHACKFTHEASQIDAFSESWCTK